ncbi:hypothetical protein, partial [Staphylococcus aureus]|uniref:hypothetical protein n=1 Tax=Staphylococcus aureus TaxID=1280 RepID=UPI00301DFA23
DANAKVAESQAKLAKLETELAEAQAHLDTLKVPEYKEVAVTTEAPATTTTTTEATTSTTEAPKTEKVLVDKSVEIAKQEEVVAAILAKVEEAKQA